MNFLRGFFERRHPIQNEDGTIVEKAPEHHENALKNQLQNQFQDTARTPVVVPPKKVEIKPHQGWNRGQDGFTFEQRYEQRHVDNIVESVYRGKLSRNRGLLQVFRYKRDTSDLNQLESTLDELMQRRQSLVVDDSDFPELIARIHDVKMKIRELKKQASMLRIAKRYWMNPLMANPTATITSIGLKAS